MALSNALDLNKEFPRSPAEPLGQYVVLARIVDKCRATINGTAGEYNYNCPVDRQFFDFTDIDADELKEYIATGASDDEIAAWCREKDSEHSDMEILTWCYEQRTRAPQTAEQKAWFEKLYLRSAPGHRHVSTWFEILDAEEGRL